MNKAFALIGSLSLWLPRASGSIYVQVGHVCVKFLIHCTYSTFAHSIFEGSPSKEGFWIRHYVYVALTDKHHSQHVHTTVPGYM